MKFFSGILVLSVISLRFAHYGCSESSEEQEPGSSTVQYDYVEATTENVPEPDLDDEEETETETNATRSGSCRCGITGKPAIDIAISQAKARLEASPLIVGGGEAAEDEYPWMVVIAKKRLWEPNRPKIICGGTLLSPRFVLTAAHCIKNQFTTQLELWLRVHNSSNVKMNSKVINIKARRLIPHPQWDEKTVSNDIGLIELATPVLFSESTGMNPACLPTKTDGDFANQQGTVIGFGYTRPQGAMANILQKLQVPILSHEDCMKTKYGNAVDNPSFLCAGYDAGGKDACTNDSGGPLTVPDKDGKHKVVGIVSWGHGCAMPRLPGVYTRVTKYLDWINSMVKRNTRCTSR